MPPSCECSWGDADAESRGMLNVPCAGELKPEGGPEPVEYTETEGGKISGGS